MDGVPPLFSVERGNPMFVHVVLFKLREPKPTLVTKALQLIDDMRGKIPGLLALETGRDLVHSRRSYDLALIASFVARADLDVYSNHPAHLPAKEFFKTFGESSVTVDFETKNEERRMKNENNRYYFPARSIFSISSGHRTAASFAGSSATLGV